MKFKINLWYHIICFVSLAGTSFCKTVIVEYNRDSPQQVYAAGRLERTLQACGYTMRENRPEFIIRLVVDTKSLESEAYQIINDKKVITVTGGDERGLIYGSLSVEESLRYGIKLENLKASNEKPHFALRAIKFDLPWDTYRHSFSLDQHIQTCKDLNYWRAFLDMMVENRFNALSLWNLHPYTYMIRAKNFPEATPFTDSQLKFWHLLFTEIFRMAKERAIDTYLIPFNIFVSPEFSKAHNVAMDNLEHHFFVKGDTSEIVKRYTRESVTQVLQEYPDLTGFGLTLGEGMAGMTPQQREDWMSETIIEGMRLANRKSKLVHRIPFSSTTGSLGITSIDTEKLTRKAIDEQGEMDFLIKPIWADLKYNWSHAHSTPTLVKVHGGKLYDTYFNPEPKNYKVTWTARNEDFFCLRWGVPDFIRSHIAENNQTYVGGYFIGSETYIPAKDYFTKLEGNFRWAYAFQRQWLFYKLWGRLLYNPATPDEIFQGEFTRRYGKQAENMLQASALAGKTPLRLGSSYDFTWDFSLYAEGFLALDSKIKRVDYISVDRQINQPPTDPNYVSIADYVKTINSGGSYESNKITPPMLAEMLERDCTKALDLIKDIKIKDNNSLRYEVADIQIWANLGLYFSEKLKGAVALQTYRTKGSDENKKLAIQYLTTSLQYWDKVVKITEPLYKEMPLVHYSEQDGKSWKENDHLRFHWKLVRPEVAKDVEVAKNAIVNKVK